MLRFIKLRKKRKMSKKERERRRRKRRDRAEMCPGWGEGARWGRGRGALGGVGWVEGMGLGGWEEWIGEEYN